MLSVGRHTSHGSAPTLAEVDSEPREVILEIRSCVGDAFKTKSSYYVSLRQDLIGRPIRGRTKAKKPSTDPRIIYWGNYVKILSSGQSRSVRFRLYEKHFIKKKLLCEMELATDDIMRNTEVSLRMSTMDENDSPLLHIFRQMSPSASVVKGDTNGSERSIAEESTNADEGRFTSRVLTAQAPVFVHSAVDILGQWGPLLDKIGLVAGLVAYIAEIHPFTSIAWSLLSAGYQLARKQQERDEAIVDLIKTLHSAYEFIIKTDDLSNMSQVQIKIVTGLARQTINCAHFIYSYIQKGFWGRAIGNPLTNTDKVISEYRAQFEQFQADFSSHGVLLIQRDVHVVLGNTDLIADSLGLSAMPYTKTARWRSGKRCLLGTRTDLITDILQWALSQDNVPRVLLLTGVAGIGKSSIANTIAGSLEELSRLAASYIFDENDKAQHRPGLLFPTIARALADAHPAFKRALVSSNSAGTFGTPDLDDQFDKLLLGPLSQGDLTFVGPLIVVVDALDESAGPGERHKMLSILAHRFHELPSNFRLLLTARAENDIQTIFDHADRIQRMHMDTKETSVKELGAFVASRLVDRNGIALPVFTEDDHHSLALKAEGLFQWAAVACSSIVEGTNLNVPPSEVEMRTAFDHFVTLPQDTPDQRMVSGSRGIGALDYLYDGVLQRLFPQSFRHLDLLRRVLGVIITSFEPLSAFALAELLDLDHDAKEVSYVILKSLGSLLIGVHDLSQPVRILHSSFRHFLLDSTKDSRFHIDRNESHLDCEIGCLRILEAQLRFNICALVNANVSNRDVLDLEQRISLNVTPILSYAARFWGLHLSYIPDTRQSPEIERHITQLLTHKFLYWIEALSLLDATSTAITTLETAIKHITTPDVRDIAQDCGLFVRLFGVPIAGGALHVYVEAYLLAPSVVEPETTSGRTSSNRDLMEKLWNTLTNDHVRYESWRKSLLGREADFERLDFTM